MSKNSAGVAHAGLTGVVLMIAATAFFASADTIAKQLAGSIPPVQIAWLRYFVFVLILVPIVIGRYGASALRSASPRLQILRGLGMLGSALLFMTGLAFLPVADATAIFFISPIAITALAVIFLGERVGWRRWLAAFVGLAGVLIIIRPGASAFQAAALLPFLAAFAWATASTVTRRMSGSDLPITTLVYSALVGILVLSAMVPFWWITPSAPQLWLALAMGILSTVGHGPRLPRGGCIDHRALRLWADHLGGGAGFHFVRRGARRLHGAGRVRHRGERHLHQLPRAPPRICLIQPAGM